MTISWKNGILYVKIITESSVAHMKSDIPFPTIERLCTIYHLLEELYENGIRSLSSKEIGAYIGAGAHTVRKDINYLGEIGKGRAGYDVALLKNHLMNHLGLTGHKKACIVGLGRLGAAILEYARLALSGFDMVAGFDRNINKLETIKTAITLYPAHEITTIVRRNGIELAVLAVPAQAAQEAAHRLIDGGIKGIVNFSPALLQTEAGVVIRNIDLINEFRIVTVLSGLSIDTQ